MAVATAIAGDALFIEATHVQTCSPYMYLYLLVDYSKAAGRLLDTG